MVKYLQWQESVDASTSFFMWVIPEYEVVDLEEEEEEEEGGEEEEEEEDNKRENQSLVLPCQHGISEAGLSDKESIPEEKYLYCLPGSTSWFGQTIHTLTKHVPLPRRTVPILQEKYGVLDFIPCLTEFIQKHILHCQIKP